MRVCLISREFPPGPQVGGVGRASYTLACALGEDGVDVTVITEALGHGVADGPFTVRTWSKQDLSKRLYYRQRLRNRWEVAHRMAQSEAAFTAAEQEARRGGQFDVVDMWMWGAEALRYPHHRDLGPLLVRLSTPDFEIRAQHGDAPRPDLDALDQRCLDAAAVIAAISEQNLDLIAGRLRVNRIRTVLTPLGVVVDEDDEPPPFASRAPDEIVFVGRLEGRKGVEDLLTAFPIVLEAHPEATLTLIGRAVGHTDNGVDFETFIAAGVSPEVSARVRVMGRLPDAQVRAAYRRAAVAVFPSRYESFGLVALEAMIHGIPVVATRAGGLPEVTGDAARLVAPCHPHELAAALIGVLSERDSAARLGAAGAERVRARYTAEMMRDSAGRAYELARKVRGGRSGGP